MSDSKPDKSIEHALSEIIGNQAHKFRLIDAANSPQDHKVTREYVLERLDQWYFSKVKNYTEAVADDLTRRTKEYVRGEESFANNLEYWLHTIEEMDKVEARFRKRTLFTDTYKAMIESGIERGIFGKTDLSKLSDGYKQEYIDPLIEHGRKMKAFVDSVRSCVPTEKPSDFLKTLSDAEIDQKYLESFRNAKGMSDFWVKYIDLTLMIYDFESNVAKYVSKEKYNRDTNYLKIIRFQQPLVSAALFSNLEQNIN